MSAKRFIELQMGESLLVGGARVTLLEKSGRRARLVVQAPESVAIIHPVPTTSAHECASTPDKGKEHSHGKHPL